MDRPPTHRSRGQHRQDMQLRLADGPAALAVFEARTEEEFAERLVRIQRTLKDQLQTTARLEVHLWHNDAWWNLSDDLAQFFAWGLETGRATPDETRRFVGAPLSRLDWLYRAARQMQRLLDAASAGQHDPEAAPSRLPDDGPT